MVESLQKEEPRQEKMVTERTLTNAPEKLRSSKALFGPEREDAKGWEITAGVACQRLPKQQKTQHRLPLWAALPSVIPGDTAGARVLAPSPPGRAPRRSSGCWWGRGGGAAPAKARRWGRQPSEARAQERSVAPHLHGPQRHAPRIKSCGHRRRAVRSDQRRRPSPEPRRWPPLHQTELFLTFHPGRRGGEGAAPAVITSRASRRRPRGGQGRGPATGPTAAGGSQAAGLVPQASGRGRQPAASH